VFHNSFKIILVMLEYVYIYIYVLFISQDFVILSKFKCNSCVYVSLCIFINGSNIKIILYSSICVICVHITYCIVLILNINQQNKGRVLCL